MLMIQIMQLKQIIIDPREELLGITHNPPVLFGLNDKVKIIKWKI